jgi:hypothetical protein
MRSWGGADAKLAVFFVDAERAEQQCRRAASVDIPQADRADQAAAIAGDQRQTVGRQAATAEEFGRLPAPVRTHRPVKQHFPGAGIGRRLSIEYDHGRLR